jgi:hypothetical protein
MSSFRQASFDSANSLLLEHGIVLVSAKGPVPRLVEVIAGEPVKGSWWAHPKSHAIFAVLNRLVESPDVLVCRLINGKVTLVHRRLWPALVRLSKSFNPELLAQVQEEHTPSGQHVSREIPFPKWVPEQVLEEAQRLTEEQARAAIGTELEKIAPARVIRRASARRKVKRRHASRTPR